MNPEFNYYPVSEGAVNDTPQVFGLDNTPKPNTETPPKTDSNVIPSPNGSVLNQGSLQSPNYSKGNSGWQIDSNGNVEFNDGTFRGALQANSIDIPDTTTTNSFHTDANGNSWWGATTLGSAPAKVLNTGAATFTNVTISGYVLQSKGAFGGDGSDGALSITSGTTTIDLANAQVVVKQYTSISITGTGKLAFSNPNTNGTYIILKSQGNVTLTSTTAPMIDASGMGAAGGAAVTTSAFTAGNNGTNGKAPFFVTNFGLGAPAATPSAPAGGAVPTFSYQTISEVLNQYPHAFVGAGGGSGNGNGAPSGGNSVTSGAGGNGGGGLVIECAGAWNFTTASGISVAGANGGNGTVSNTADRSAGGGGGGGGYCLVLYNTLTANSGTITSSGGTGGNSAATMAGDATNNGGGGGGASATTAGSAGTNNVGAGNKSGGDGGAGTSSVIQNVLYA